MATTPQPTAHPRRTQAERREVSGRRLLAAAAALIAEKGWEAASAAEIGRRAGYSRAMVHARYGSKDALLDTLFRSEYEQRLIPTPDPTATGLERVLTTLNRLEELFHEDPEFLESMFVVSFEAVKRATPLRPRMVAWMNQISTGVEEDLRAGLADGSVRPDTDVDAAANEMVAAAVGVAYGWIVLPNRFDLPTELDRLRARIVRDHGTPGRANRSA